MYVWYVHIFSACQLLVLSKVPKIGFSTFVGNFVDDWRKPLNNSIFLLIFKYVHMYMYGMHSCV